MPRSRLASFPATATDQSKRVIIETDKQARTDMQCLRSHLFELILSSRLCQLGERRSLELHGAALCFFGVGSCPAGLGKQPFSHLYSLGFGALPPSRNHHVIIRRISFYSHGHLGAALKSDTLKQRIFLRFCEIAHRPANGRLG